LLKKLFGKVIAPSAVINECLSDITRPGGKEILDAIHKQLITPNDNSEINHHQSLIDILGLGEAHAIILATQLNARLLMDDKLGRQTAEKMNLRIIGTAGVLILAKKKNLILKIAPLIKELKNAGYYLSNELIKKILIIAGEKI